MNRTQETQSQNLPFDPVSLLRRLLRHWWQFVLVAVVAVGAGVALAYTVGTPLFRAEAVLLYNPANNDLSDEFEIIQELDETMTFIYRQGARRERTENTACLSPTFTSMFGYADDEMENSPEAWQRTIFPDDLPLLLNQVTRHFETHGASPVSAEVRYMHKDGHQVDVYCRGKVIEWGASGEPVRMVGAHIDITEMKKIQRDLERSTALFSRSEELAHVGGWEVRESGAGKELVMIWTSEVYRIHNRSPELGPPSVDEAIGYCVSRDRLRAREA